MTHSCVVRKTLLGTRILDSSGIADNCIGKADSTFAQCTERKFDKIQTSVLELIFTINVQPFRLPSGRCMTPAAAAE